MGDSIDVDRATASAETQQLAGRVGELLEARERASTAFFDRHAEPIARLCHRMAERFARDGRLVAFGSGPVGRSDARHVAVEFVHPVIVGKRALPALALASEGGPLAAQVAEACAMTCIAFGPTARRRGDASARSRAAIASRPQDPARSGSSWRRPPPIASSARRSSRRSTTCCGSSCTSSSTIAGCWRGARRDRCTTAARRAL